MNTNAVSNDINVNPKARTPYQTLVPVNNIDQSKFVQTDLATISKHWNKVFFSNTVSEDIYDAIAAKSGTSDPRTDQVSI